MRTLAVIPARYGSTRLPGKPLCLIAGKPLVQHVYEVAAAVSEFDEICVATDDIRIHDAVVAFGGKAVMTSTDCASGTDRLCEVMQQYHADIYVNIQGDEPLLRSDDLRRLARCMLDDEGIMAATLYAPISAAEAVNPNVVKLVMTHNGKALYFSRSPIPYPREARECEYWGHIGVYGYRASTLKRYSSLPASPLEQAEKLEQLRLLQAGITLHAVKAKAMGRGVDTQEDLEDVRTILEGHKKHLIQKHIYNSTKASVYTTVNTEITIKEFEILEKLKKIKLIITDVDGVLTDGSLYYGSSGEILKQFNVKDGFGIKLAHDVGLKIAVLTGRNCDALQVRLRELGITLYETDIVQKSEACQRIIERAGVSSEETLFLGDDIPDAAAFSCCAIGAAVADATPYVLDRASWIIKSKGGKGALREVIDYIINIAYKE